MKPTLCSRCKKNVAVIFITKIENGVSTNEGLCLKCAKELGIKQVDDMVKQMGISDEDIENMSGEMMSLMGGNPDEDGGEDDEPIGPPIGGPEVVAWNDFPIKQAVDK